MQERELFSVSSEKKTRQLIYIPEKCIGCGTCVQACPKSGLSIGAIGSIVRKLFDADFLERKDGDCLICEICARVCPTGALELRQEGKTLNDMSYIFEAMKPTTVNENCIYLSLIHI